MNAKEYLNRRDNQIVAARELVEGLDEGQCLDIFNAMRKMRGWGGSIFIEGDARGVWENDYPDIPWSEDIWGEFQNTYGWSHLADATEDDWYKINDAAEDVYKRLTE